MQITDNGSVIVVAVVEDRCSNLWLTVEPYMTQGRKAVVLDLSAVNFLNSVNIAAIITCRNKVENGGGRMTVANVQDRVKLVFRVLKLERLFNLDQDVAAASQAALKPATVRVERPPL